VANYRPDGPRTTFLGKLVILAFLAACAVGTYRLYQTRGGKAPAAAAAVTTGLGIAASDDKLAWLQSAAEEFGKSDAGRGVQVRVVSMPSRLAANEIASGDEAIQVWAPESSAMQGNTPVVGQELHSIALTPMVFAAFSARAAALPGADELSFAALEKALSDRDGWAAHGHAEWGLVKFGMPDPAASYAGAEALALMAYDATEKTKGLGAPDAVSPPLRTSLAAMKASASLARDAGALAREVVLRGPAAYDMVFTTEAAAVAALPLAQTRFGEMRIVYPRRNLWNDNPYYILDVPWNSDAQRKAAKAFLDFLMTETSQKKALQYGFRPADPHVALTDADSPFVLYAKNGLKNDVGEVCEQPKPETIENLLAAWQRAR
jgi:ABC-type Fe3+ transport system substrate-binding protein